MKYSMADFMALHPYAEELRGLIGRRVCFPLEKRYRWQSKQRSRMIVGVVEIGTMGSPVLNDGGPGRWVLDAGRLLALEVLE